MSAPLQPAAPVSALLRDKRIVVCCGAGGVGKTTTAAAMALAAACSGRRVLVLTIDPARRLAEAMGIDAAGERPTPLPADRLEAAGIRAGRIDAWMLNPSEVFEAMIRRLAPTPRQAERILGNRLYRHLSEMIAGMQEYTAAEALWELSQSGEYDLIVLDTPPSRNALDFLEAPGRLGRFLDDRILHLFLPGQPGPTGLWRRAGALLGTVFSRVFGQGFYQELQEFLEAFSGLFAALRHHAEGVRALLASEEAAFLLVTSPESGALSEAVYLRDKLVGLGLPFSGFVLNRSYAHGGGLRAPESIELPVDAPAEARSALSKLKVLAASERERMARDRRLLRRLKEIAPRGAVAVAAPHLGEAIEDLSGLAQLALRMTATGPEAT